MDRLKLRELVWQFLEDAEPSMHLESEGEDAFTLPEVAETWSRLPDCQLTAMFLGYAIGKGVDIDTFTNIDLEKAVQTLALKADAVDFDWIGDIDATSKPH